jgi:hypothetical protein
MTYGPDLNIHSQETGVSKSSARTATQLLKTSSETWCLVCCKCKKDYCTWVFNETITCERCLRADGQRFQHLLWSVNKGKNFPSFQMLSAKFGCAGRGEAQSRQRGNFITKHPMCLIHKWIKFVFTGNVFLWFAPTVWANLKSVFLLLSKLKSYIYLMCICFFNPSHATSYIWGSRLIGTKYSRPDVSQLTGIHYIFTFPLFHRIY